MSNNLVAFNIRLPKKLHEYTKKESEERGLTMNAVIIFALETYFNQQQVIPHLGDLVEASKLLEKQNK